MSSKLSASNKIKKTPRQRTFLTHEAKVALEQFYLLDPYPSQDRMDSIAKEVAGISGKNVKLWFQNRRAKERQDNPSSNLRRCRRSKPSSRSSKHQDNEEEEDDENEDYQISSPFQSISPSESILTLGKITSEVSTPSKQLKSECESEDLPYFDFFSSQAKQFNNSELTPNQVYSPQTSPMALSSSQVVSQVIFELPDYEALLITSSRTGNLPLIRILLQAGVDINARDPMTGSTALMEAVAAGNLELANELLAFHASTEIGDNFGRRPLHIAAQFDRKEILEVLLSNFANIESTDQGGFTPIQVAVAMGSVSCVSQLIISGANTCKMTKEGQSLFDLAQLSQSSNSDIIIRMLQVYATTNVFLPSIDTFSSDDF